jgi:HK97 gp10 family phage protein
VSADGTRFKLVGGDELFRRLHELPAKVAKTIGRRALRDGAKEILLQAKANVPVRSGRLKKSLKVRAGKQRKKETISVLVSTGKKWFTGDTFYGAFVEFGHRFGRRRLGNSRRKVDGKRFVERAYEERREAAATRVLDSLRTGIEAEAGK